MDDEALAGKEITGQRDSYIIDQHLARGTRSNIYRVIPRSTEMYKCAKVLTFQMNDGDLRMLQREEAFLSRLDHRNIVRLHDSAVIGGFHCTIMDYFPDGSLADRLRAGPLSYNDLIHILEQVAAAIDYAHDKSVIHQDIKPANILLNDKWATLSDFGIARIIGEQVSTKADSDVMGTPAYMSPEQAYGQSTRNETDIYALGVVAFEALTGQIPFKANSPMATLQKIISEPTPDLTSLNPEIPKSVNAVVRAALAKQPSHRYKSATTFVHSLKQALRDPEADPVLPEGYLENEAKQALLHDIQSTIDEAEQLAEQLLLDHEPYIPSTLYDLPPLPPPFPPLNSDAFELQKQLFLQEIGVVHAGLMKAAQLSLLLKTTGLVLWWASLAISVGLAIFYAADSSMIITATALLPLLFWLIESLWRWQGYDFAQRAQFLASRINDSALYRSVENRNLSDAFISLFDPMGKFSYPATSFLKIFSSPGVCLVYLIQIALSIALGIGFWS